MITNRATMLRTIMIKLLSCRRSDLLGGCIGFSPGPFLYQYIYILITTWLTNRQHEGLKSETIRFITPSWLLGVSAIRYTARRNILLLQMDIKRGCHVPGYYP